MNNYQDLMIREKTKLNILHPIKLIKEKIENNKIEHERLKEERMLYNEWINKINNPKVIKFQEQCYNFFLKEVRYPLELVFNTDSVSEYELNSIEELAEMITIILFNDKYKLIDCDNPKNVLGFRYIKSLLEEIKKCKEKNKIERFSFVYELILNTLKEEGLTFYFKKNEFERICVTKKNEKISFVKTIIGSIIATIVLMLFLYIFR